MSPFSKVEMSPFVLVRRNLQHERYGAGGAPTTDEPTRTDAAGSNSTNQAQDAKTTSSSGAIVTLGTPGETSLQSLPERGSCGADFKQRDRPSNHRLPEKTINPGAAV